MFNKGEAYEESGLSDGDRKRSGHRRSLANAAPYRLLRCALSRSLVFRISEDTSCSTDVFPHKGNQPLLQGLIRDRARDRQVQFPCLAITEGEPARAQITAQSLLGFKTSGCLIKQATSRTYPAMVCSLPLSSRAGFCPQPRVLRSGKLTITASTTCLQRS